MRLKIEISIWEKKSGSFSRDWEKYKETIRYYQLTLSVNNLEYVNCAGILHLLLRKKINKLKQWVTVLLEYLRYNKFSKQ